MKINTVSISNTVSQDQYEVGLGPMTFEVDVNDGSKITLPDAFKAPIRPDLVRRAIRAAQANRRQAYGSRAHGGKRKPMAGMKFSVEWWGKGRGVSRIMRKTGQRTGAQNPHTRQGRRAHGPKVEKDWSLKINSSERRSARHSALAAVVDVETVKARGHRLDDDVSQLPIILDEYTEIIDGEKTTMSFEDFTNTKPTRKMIAILRALGLGPDLDRARNGRHRRAGKGKMRGRVTRQPKSVLIITNGGESLERAARNLPGVDVIPLNNLSTENLAPGGDLGRLTVFTREAMEAI